MKVSFSTVNPNDFSRAIVLTTKRKKNTVKTAEEKEQIRLEQKELTARKEQMKNRLLEKSCGNINCKNTLEYVYEDRKSLYLDLKEANWVHFASTECYLCPTCSNIQKNRLKQYDNTLD